jgi:hypothetical protein
MLPAWRAAAKVGLIAVSKKFIVQLKSFLSKKCTIFGNQDAQPASRPPVPNRLF